MTMSAEHMPHAAAGSAGGAAGSAAGAGGSAETPDAPARTVTVGRLDVDAGYRTVRSRGASTWLLTWTLAGAGRLRQGGTSVLARPGGAVLLGPGVQHEYGTDPEAGRWDFWWVHFTPHGVWEPRLRRFAVGGGIHVVPEVPVERHERIGVALRQVHADARWSAEGAPVLAGCGEGAPVSPAVAISAAGRELAQAGMEVLLVLLTAAAGSASDGVDVRVRRAESLIAADPAAPHSAQSLAVRVSMSPSRLSHLFTEQTGRSIGRAVREARLRHAEALLESTDLEVAQVARASGFVSPFHFSRVFSAVHGMPPREFRQR
jgi:AraC family transcriptional regulator of arabinose operon